MRTLWILLIILLTLVSGSCGSPQAGTEPAPELPPGEPEIVPTENPLELERTQEATEMSSVPPIEKFVTLAKEDLAGRLGVEADRITLVKSAEKLWLNAALGCPRPGVFYPSGRVPGFQIWLEAEGKEYVYNTDFNGNLILCPELNPDVQGLDTGPTPGVPIR
jgi:hypothetical protein